MKLAGLAFHSVVGQANNLALVCYATANSWRYVAPLTPLPTCLLGAPSHPLLRDEATEAIIAGRHQVECA